jgi:DNA-binding LacI/PurR family transcriptional regulator
VASSRISAVSRRAETVGRPATLKDVAVVSGVTTATVSAVVHGADWVSDATRARVQAAIDTLGYRPNHLARALQRRSRRAGAGRPDARTASRSAEVAAACGVSPTTVSNVVRGIAGMTPATRAHVRIAVETMGYRPDRVARALRLWPELGVAQERAD